MLIINLNIELFDLSDLIVSTQLCNESISRNPLKVFFYLRIIDVKSTLNSLITSVIFFSRVTILEYLGIFQHGNTLLHRDYNFEENSNNKIILSR